LIDAFLNFLEDVGDVEGQMLRRRRHHRDFRPALRELSLEDGQRQLGSDFGLPGEDRDHPRFNPASAWAILVSRRGFLVTNDCHTLFLRPEEVSRGRELDHTRLRIKSPGVIRKRRGFRILESFSDESFRSDEDKESSYSPEGRGLLSLPGLLRECLCWSSQKCWND